MKLYLPVALALVCIGLIISVVMMKRGADAQHEADAGTITDCSNRLDSAHTQIAFCIGTMLTLSNRLDESRSASLTFSNHLREAESALAFDAEQITNLTRRVAEVESENQTLQTASQRLMDLTNQMAGLSRQMALTETNLAQADKDYALLENRLRRDVAERLVVERKFYNLAELRAQMERLRTYPGGDVSAESIYAGLDVEVKSNTVHVISPN
jgi:chromosome segregation ATPase